jgi:hypothetical protein
VEKEDNRAAIINSTVRAVAELGFHGASMAVIASGEGTERTFMTDLNMPLSVDNSRSHP